MNEYLVLKGSEHAVTQQLSQQLEISDDDALCMLSFLINRQPFFSGGEFIIISKPAPMALGMAAVSEKYHVNLKITTLAMCALLLDITITKGVMGSVLSLAGFPGKALVKLDEYEGQQCILREVLMSENKTGHSRILDKFHGQCCNNDLRRCRYRSEGRCTCHPAEVEKIFQELEKNNVFRGDNAGYYHYCL